MPIHNNDDKCFEVRLNGRILKFYYDPLNSESKKLAYKASVLKEKKLIEYHKTNFLR